MRKVGLYAVTIFISAFLLFQVQPLIAKIILPWFGGSAAVWSASLLFFQLVLLAGYTYAHVSIRCLSARAQMLVHAALLLLSCALLPILPSPAWRPTGPGDPTFRILTVLGATIGLPYFLLSATSPLLQAWYVRRSGSGMPYRLFALSNFGSMLALVSFPFLVEPHLASRAQAFGWSTGYVVFALLCVATAWVSRKAAPATSPAEAPAVAGETARPGFAQFALWVLLAACASVLLISVTNQLSANVAPIPLLWIIPLALYLATFILAFENDRIYQRWHSPLIISQDWEVLDNTGTIIAATTGNILNYTFPVAGLYTVKLVINRNQPCSDSTTAIIRVFPGFIPDFTSTGICVTKPTFFYDRSTSVYGTVNSWKWDFGDLTTTLDYSSIQDPTYTYPISGTKDVRLIVTDTRGCRDTINKNVVIIDKPPISLAFRDTLICNIDNLMLQAGGTGSFSWSPPVNIINANTATPIVSPLTTTTYYVDLYDNGCINRDSVKVRVVDHVSLQAMNDTTICRSDTIQLKVFSDGLKYIWTPASQLIDPTVQDPLAVTFASTNYQVTAIIGGCSANDNIYVTTVPYPLVNAGADSTICYNSTAYLHGTTDGSSWQWSPPNSLSNSSLLNTIGYPPRTTAFILTAYDTKGCPKPGRDTVIITVLPKMHISAGRDTAVITGQPLHLNATGGESYTWSPATFLSSTTTPNPVAMFSDPSTGIRYKVIAFTNEGCSDSAFITIKVFKTLPTVFVPSAFTPNNDGLNDILRPIAVGIKSIDYFNIYNRWGQLLFSTKINGYGWDGKINGQLQSTGTFVWMVRATDYTGAAYFQKGVFTLIR